MIDILRNKYIMSMLYKVVLTIITLLISIVVNRFLGPELRGEQAYIINIVTWLTMLGNLGIYQSYPFFLKKEIDYFKHKFITILLFQFGFYMILSSIAIIFSKDMITWILILFPIMNLLKQLDFFAIIDKIYIRNRIVLEKQLIYLLGVIVLSVSTSPSYGKVLIVILLAQVYEIVMINIKYKLLKYFKCKYFDVKMLIDLIKNGYIPMFNIMLTNANYNFDIIILKMLVSYKELGLYSVGVSLAMMTWIIPDAFKEVLFSKISENRVIDEVTLIVKLNIYISIIISILFLILGRLIILFMFGIEYVDSYNVIGILLIGTIPMGIFKLIRPVFLSNGKDWISTILLLFSVISNIILNIILIPLFGIEGAAFASVASYFVSGIGLLTAFINIYNIKAKDILFFSINDLKSYKKLFFVKEI